MAPPTETSTEECQNCEGNPEPRECVNGERVHPTVTRAHIKNNNLRPGEHKAMDLVTAFSDVLKEPKVDTPRKRREIALFRWRKNRQQLKGSLNKTKTPSDKPLADLYTILDDVFFLGTLRDVPINWVPDLKSDTGDRLLAYTRFKSDTHFVTIELDPNASDESIAKKFGKISRFQYTVNACLHEMVHAMFFRYSCYKACSCKGTKCCDQTIEDIGPTGHGRAWQLLSKAVEDAGKEILGFDVDLARKFSYKWEVEHDGVHLSEEDTARVFPGERYPFIPSG